MVTAVCSQAHAPRRLLGTHVPCYVFEHSRDLARSVAQTVANLIRERYSFGQTAVLGLPTGSTPVGVYRELIRMHREEGLDFSGVVRFFQIEPSSSLISAGMTPSAYIASPE